MQPAAAGNGRREPTVHEQQRSRSMTTNTATPTQSDTERIARFKEKYGAATIDNGMRLRPDDFLDEVEWRDRIE